MSDALDDLLGDNSNPDGDGQSGKGLRAQLEKVLEQNRTLTEQLAQVQAKQRDTALESLFTRHGVPTKARDFFPKDTEPSDEAVTAFVEQYGELWGQTAAPATTPPEQQQATAAMQQLAAEAGRSSSAIPQTVEEFQARFAEAKTKAEFMQQLAEFEAQAMAADLGD